MKCMEMWINVLVSDYRFLKELEYAVKLLPFVNGNFCSEMLAICSLVQIDVIKEKMINCEFKCLLGCFN